MPPDAEARPEPIESTYGSDKHGLVCAYQLLPGSPAVPLDATGLTAWLQIADEPSTESFVWLHFSLSNTASERWLHQHLSLPDDFFQSLWEESRSTRLEQIGDQLVGVLHDARFDFTFDPGSVATVNFCLAPRFLVTARLRPVRSVDRLRGAVKNGETFGSPADLLAHLLRYQAEVLVDITREATSRIDAVEDQLLANKIAMSRRELGSLRRTLVRFQRLLAPEPAALFRVLSRSPGWVDAEDLQNLRQAAEEFSTAIADSGSVVERVKLLQEELAALVGEQTGRTLFILTVVTVLALPINLVAGLFGMNVGGVPFSGHRHGFFVVVAVVSAFTLLAAYLALGRKRW